VPQFVQLLTSRVLPAQLMLSTSNVQGPGFKQPLWRCRVLLIPIAPSPNAPSNVAQPLIVDEPEMLARAHRGVLIDASTSSDAPGGSPVANVKSSGLNYGLSDPYDVDGLFCGDVRHALFTGVEARVGDVGAAHALGKSTRKAVTAKAAWRFFEQNFPVAAAKLLRDIPRGSFFDAIASPPRDQLARITAADLCPASLAAMTKEALHVCGVYKAVEAESRAKAAAILDNQQRPVAKVPKPRAKKGAKGFGGNKKKPGGIQPEREGLLPPRAVAFGVIADASAPSPDDALLDTFASGGGGGDALDDLFAGGTARMASIDGRRAPPPKAPPKANTDTAGDMTALLTRLLLERRNTQLRITAARVGPGIHVVLYGTPRRAGSGTGKAALLDFAAERELGDAIDQSEARATRVACIRILQDLFPDDLLAYMESQDAASLPL
jgi:hypothetical protein